MDVIQKYIKKFWGLLILTLLLPLTGMSQEFSDGYISAIVSYQNTVAQGDTLPITIKIIKNDINGFAKFKCSSPQSMQILSPDFVNASATIKDSILEVIWVEIPFEKEFLIEYKLVVPNTSPITDFRFSGSFYYLIDKDIKVLKFTNLPFSVTDDKVAIKKSQTEYKVQAQKREKNTQSVLMAKDNRDLSQPIGDSLTLAAQRSISNLNEVPSQPLVEEPKTTEPSVDIPTSEPKVADSTLALAETKNPDSAIVQPQQIDSVVTEPKVEEPIISETPKAEEPKEDEKPIEQPKVEKPTPTQKPEKVSQSNEGVEYRVQIAASRKRMSESQLKKIYKGDLKIEENERGDGWIRYSIAQSTSYSDVKKAKKQCGVVDAFISATSNGKPISVSEALRNAKPGEERTYGKIFYAVQTIALNNYMPISEFKQKYNTDKLIFVEKDGGYYKYLIGYFFSFREANAYRISLGGDAFVVSYMNGKRLDKAQSIK